MDTKRSAPGIFAKNFAELTDWAIESARYIGPCNLASLLDLSVDMIAQEPEVHSTIDGVINRIAILGRDHSCGICQPKFPSPTESGFQLQSNPHVGFPSPTLSSHSASERSEPAPDPGLPERIFGNLGQKGPAHDGNKSPWKSDPIPEQTVG
ncbi:MAG: hypothetical protein L6R37_007853 [Teloschistes peruensis]|nr:MAG: hypothetical protein L6R37_007853 [Teloschistes peruensis]